MDDAGDYRYTRRRRAITVAVSVVATVALCVGYAVADMCDVAPGVLTLRHVEHSTAAAAGRSIEAADVIADIDASKTIDPAAARALTDAFRASAAGFGGEFSIAIADASGNVVAENNIDVPRTPASTMKTLTAYAAAVELDMGRTLDTQTYLEQSQDGTARLVLKGNGDMLLGAGRHTVRQRPLAARHRRTRHGPPVLRPDSFHGRGRRQELERDRSGQS